jgi:hypothetical protein
MVTLSSSDALQAKKHADTTDITFCVAPSGGTEYPKFQSSSDCTIIIFETFECIITYLHHVFVQGRAFVSV